MLATISRSNADISTTSVSQKMTLAKYINLFFSLVIKSLCMMHCSIAYL